MKHLSWLTIFIVILTLLGCVPKDPLAGIAKGEMGRVVEVLDGDTIALNTGLVVRLTCVTAPNLNAIFGPESKRILEDLVQGRDVQLYYDGLTRDKFGRALAHIKTADSLGPPLWINQSLIQQGAAWLDIYPDTAQACAGLVGNEMQAFDTREGLWRKRDYKPDESNTCCKDKGVKFIQSEVLNAKNNSTEQVCSLSFVRLNISAYYAGPCDQSHKAPGSIVRVRGYFDGRAIDARHPLNVRVLPSQHANP